MDYYSWCVGGGVVFIVIEQRIIFLYLKVRSVNNYFFLGIEVVQRTNEKLALQNLLI